MLRKSVHRTFLVCLLALAAPFTAVAATQLTHAQAIIAKAKAVATATGTVTSLGGSYLSIQTNGRLVGVTNAMVGTANALTKKNYNYVWGGGHPEAGVPTKSGRKLGYDCSGAVAAVLAGAGLWPSGGDVPDDAGVIDQLKAEGLIAKGPGKAPYNVTLYDHPGYHIFMSINGRFFGTSDGSGSGVTHGGPGWLYDGAPDSHLRSFRQWHIIPSVLKNRASYGNTLTFSTSDWSLLQEVLVGDKVSVSYASTGNGSMVATGLTFPGAVTVSGTVWNAGSKTLTVQTTGGQTLTLAVGKGVETATSAGDTVEILYTKTKSGLLARQLTVTGEAAPTGQPGSGQPGSGQPGSGWPPWGANNS